jgi:hypothetical protein
MTILVSHLYIYALTLLQVLGTPNMIRRTFLAEGSETPLTMLLSSFLMVLAATPVVAERKSCSMKHDTREEYARMMSEKVGEWSKEKISSANERARVIEMGIP